MSYNTSIDYANFKTPTDLALYVAELTRQNIRYEIVNESDGSWSVKATGY